MGIENLKAYYEEAAQATTDGLPVPANYHVKVAGVDEATDTYLRLQTEVVCGEQAGRRAPNISIFAGDYDFEAKVSVPTSHKRFFQSVVRIANGPIDPGIEVDPTAEWNEQVMQAFGDAMTGLEFVAKVDKEKKKDSSTGKKEETGYNKIAKITPVSESKCDCRGTAPSFS